jgi:hypothetical protein
MSDTKGFFKSVSETPPEFSSFVIALIVVAAVAVVGAVAYPFVTSVGSNEIVIEDCDGDLTVWRSPRDAGLHWDGLCRTETYHADGFVRFKEPVQGADADVTLRGSVAVKLPSDDEAMRQLHRTYGSYEAFLDTDIVPVVLEELRAAAADPDWHQPKGGYVARKAKDALEYTLKRVSPVGAIWTSPEAKRALTEDVRRRLAARTFPPGVMVRFDLGFVTER